MDEYAKKVENGEPVSAQEKLDYYELKKAVGEKLSPEEQQDENKAIQTRTKEVANDLKQDILDTYTKDTAVVINAKIALLKEIDPEAAHAIEVKFAKERAANEKTKEAKYLADFKELDRSKTNEYLEGQKGKDLSYYAGEFGEGLLSSLPTKDEIKESLKTGGLYLINPALGSAYEFNKRVETVTGLADNISEQGAGNYLGNVAENVKEKVTEHPAEVAGFIAGELIENALINKGLSVSGITSAENVLGVTGKADDVSKKYYRYIDEGEANVIRNTGEIPNTNKYGDPKDIFITDRRYETAGGAKTYNQLPLKPEYRIEIDPENVPNRTPFTKIEPNHHPEWGKGRGVEAITKDPIPVNPDDLVKLKGTGK